MGFGIDSLASAYTQVLGRYPSGGGNTVGSDKQYGAWYEKLYGADKTSSVSASDFDYKAKQEEVKQRIAEYKQSTEKLQTLKKDSADFLTKYTDKMTKMGESAKAVQDQNLTKLLGDVSGGEVSAENMQKTTDAVQSMVDSYNDALTTLSGNTDRGSGVTRQLGRMQQSPAAEAAMNLVGVTRGTDGKLSFDKEKFTKTVHEAAKADARLGSSARMDLIKDIVGGSSSIASGVRNDSQAGLNTSASSLIGNDLAKMQNQQNPLNMNNIYTRAGAQSMMNMGAVGLLMNLSA